MTAYDHEFFKRRAAEGHVADTILKTVLPLAQPQSIVDLGTAVGTWLDAAKRAGVGRVVGIDGPWVPADQMLINKDEFVCVNLENDLPNLGKFDLAICTEVLEHISGPASERAIKWLCQSAPIVLFSAAMPGQGGDSHINEQWQSHWAGLFASQGYKTYDIIRPQIFGDRSIPFWYKQNLLLMMHESVGTALGLTPSSLSAVDLVSRDLYEEKVRMVDELEAKLESRKLKNKIRRLLR